MPIFLIVSRHSAEDYPLYNGKSEENDVRIARQIGRTREETWSKEDWSMDCGSGTSMMWVYEAPRSSPNMKRKPKSQHPNNPFFSRRYATQRACATGLSWKRHR
jgi:hypothetical protein